MRLRIRELMRAQKIKSANALLLALRARGCSLTCTRLSRLVNGFVRSVDIGLVPHLCAELRCSADELFGLSEAQMRPKRRLYAVSSAPQPSEAPRPKNRGHLGRLGSVRPPGARFEELDG